MKVVRYFLTKSTMWVLCVTASGVAHAQAEHLAPNTDPNAYVTPVPLDGKKVTKTRFSKSALHPAKSNAEEEGHSMTPQGALDPAIQHVLLNAGFEEPEFVRPGSHVVAAWAPLDVLSPDKFFQSLSSESIVAGRIDLRTAR